MSVLTASNIHRYRPTSTSWGGEPQNDTFMTEHMSVLCDYSLDDLDV